MVIIGELAGLGCALSWALASNIFSVSVKIYTPLLLNFVKCSISASVLFLIMLLFHDKVFPEAELDMYIYLFASGISGIAIGDTFYFKALEILGPKTTILMETLAPPFTGVLAFVYYGDTISLLGWVGILLTIAGITVVIKEKNQEQNSNDKQLLLQETNTELPLLSFSQQQNQLYNNNNNNDNNKGVNQMQRALKNEKIMGIVFGATSMFFHSVGMILSHDALRTRAFDPISSSCFRLIAGSLALAVVIHFKKSESFIIPSQSLKLNMLLGLGILLGPILCILCQQLSLMYTRPEVAQTLIGTTPIFAIFISIAQGQKVSQRYVMGSILALMGVALIVFKQ